ncbi:hypothetical protein ACFLSJ_02365 [Verrucomicrobiota bacterium]
MKTVAFSVLVLLATVAHGGDEYILAVEAMEAETADSLAACTNSEALTRRQIIGAIRDSWWGLSSTIGRMPHSTEVDEAVLQFVSDGSIPGGEGPVDAARMTALANALSRVEQEGRAIQQALEAAYNEARLPIVLRTTRLSEPDFRAITAVLHEWRERDHEAWVNTDLRLVDVTAPSTNRARVETGHVTGPISGNGMTFHLIRTNRTWQIVKTGSWVK